MQVFTQAILAYYAANLATAFPGGMFHKLAPPNTTSPFIVYNIVNANSSSHYGGVSFSEPEIQFTVWNKGDDTSLGNIQTLITALDENRLSASFFVLRMTDAMASPDSPTKDSAGNSNYGWIVSYRYGITS